MNENAQAAGGEGLGLAELRRRRGISLEAIADKTKISMHFLRAIEAEDFKKLPGGIFNTSYIRQYAESIGADELDILGKYVSFVDSAEPASLPAEFGMSRLEHAFRR